MTKDRVLVYIPNGLNTPELEILLAQAQREINKKKKLIFCYVGVVIIIIVQKIFIH